VLAEHNVHQCAIAVDGPVQIAPVAVNLDVGLVDIPASADAAAVMTTELFGQSRDEFRLPVPHRLVTEHNASDQEHLGKIT
jgi:hypothetical protein